MWFSGIIAVLAIWYGYSRSKKPTGIEINHVTTFTLGFLFYWVIPPAFGILARVATENQAVSAWLDYLTNVPASRLFEYNLTILLCYFAFAAGDRIGYRKPKVLRKKSFQVTLWRMEWYFCLVLFMFVLIKLRGQLFGDYGGNSDTDNLARGTLTALSLVLFSIAWKFTLRGHPAYMKAYFVCAVFLLLMGERLYFASSIISLLAYISSKKTIRPRALLVWGLAAILAMGLIATVRMQAGVSVLFVLLSVAYESVFTSFSLMSYMQYNNIPFFGFPKYLTSDLLNLVPSVFIDKSNFPVLTDNSSLGIVSPLGAFHSWVSFMVNFGVIGTVLFMFLFGYLMRRNQGLSTPYLMLTGFVTFTFFRDPFSISLVKNMLEFSILIPLVLSELNNFVAYAVKNTYGTIAKPFRRKEAAV
jgi:hypothetical protein